MKSSYNFLVGKFLDINVTYNECKGLCTKLTCMIVWFQARDNFSYIDQPD